jgi:NTE family protein
MARTSTLLLLALATALAGCAYPRTAKLQEPWTLARGYRFTRTDAPGSTAQHAVAARRAALEKADKLFVVLSFSGGGTRAGALAYGVLAQLEAVRIHVADDGELVDCPKWDSDECKKLERSLLDEVDVISSVSGGSFTSAYYGLKGKEIFEPESRFRTNFLYYNVQRQLMANAVYHPAGWAHLGSRVEIASRYYQRHIFGDSTFAALEARPRPFIIVNADDMSSGNRFEFTQDQFDLLCADLRPFPIARAVAASSAFPGLLNSMTINSHNGESAEVSPCAYTGPGSPGNPSWVKDVLDTKYLQRSRYRNAAALAAYRDPSRRYLHLLDGGLADNIGMRAVSEALASADRLREPWPANKPDQLNNDPDVNILSGNWSLQQLLNDHRIKTLIVIAVNAKTDKTTTWDRHARGPSTLAVLGATRGTPMSNFSNETVDRIQEQTQGLDTPAFTFEVAFEDITDPAARTYFLNLPTSFSLSRTQADCLIANAPTLLKAAAAINEVDADQSSLTFEEVVKKKLFGRLTPPDSSAVPASPPSCRLNP